jgi:curli production assembly/transport component CsgE
MKLQFFLLALFFCNMSALYAQKTDSIAQDSLMQLPQHFQKIFQQADSLKKVARDPEPMGIGRLIIDETVSKFGRDFYDIFYANWEENEKMPDFLLTIRERPLPSIGSIISIDLNGDILWEQRIQPRADELEASAIQAVIFFYQYLSNYQAIQESLDNEDQDGSGIY